MIPPLHLTATRTVFHFSPRSLSPQQQKQKFSPVKKPIARKISDLQRPEIWPISNALWRFHPSLEPAPRPPAVIEGGIYPKNASEVCEKRFFPAGCLRQRKRERWRRLGGCTPSWPRQTTTRKCQRRRRRFGTRRKISGKSQQAGFLLLLRVVICGGLKKT